MENRGLLRNAFTSKIWNSKIRSANVTGKERIFGYIIGPFGIMMLQSIVISYFNQYMTDVLGFNVSKGAWVAVFMVMFPLISKIFDAISNIVMAKLLDKTFCKQGKLRPWFLLSLPIVIGSVFMLFWVPFESTYIQAIWVVFCYNLFYAVGYTMWYMSYELMAPLSTRNIQQRSGNSLAGQITKNIGTGFISILFPTILVGVTALVGGGSREGYFYTISILCCIAVPLTLLQYFYTRERITEERRNQYGIVNDEGQNIIDMKEEATFKTQLKSCLKDKFWIMLIAMFLLYQVLNGLKTISLIYYSAWVINGNAYGELASIQAKFQMIAMAPMGPGLLLLLPAFKKFGRRKTIIVGSILTIGGSAYAFMGAGQTLPVYVGTAISSIGAMTFMYSMMTFIGDTIDHVEYSQGIRVEGFTAALVGFAECVSKGVSMALYNLGLTLTNYMVPEKIGMDANGVALYADQPASATQWINFSFQGSFFLMGVLFFVLFAFFFKIEGKMKMVHDFLQEKKRKECLDMGIEYIPSHELERMEREEQKKEAEIIRIKELKKICERRGKNFEAENEKFLAKRSKKEAKKQKRKDKKNKK